jgi:hypothetical protein
VGIDDGVCSIGVVLWRSVPVDRENGPRSQI